MSLDAGRPCSTFAPPARRRARRRANDLHFVEQDGRRFVVKSFADPDDVADDAARRARRELDAIEAFRRAGTAALEPLGGPFDAIRLDVDGRAVEVRHALVFPFVEAPTLYDAIGDSRDARPLVAEAGRRIGARHKAATTLAAVHTDGSAHNVFADWTWFDFCEPHAGDQLRECKGLELLRFVASVVELSGTRAGRSRVAAFREGYDDDDILALALDFSRTDETYMRTRMWARMLGRPDKLFAYWRGDTKHFRRIRTWDALKRALR